MTYEMRANCARNINSVNGWMHKKQAKQTNLEHEAVRHARDEAEQQRAEGAERSGRPRSQSHFWVGDRKYVPGQIAHGCDTGEHHSLQATHTTPRLSTQSDTENEQNATENE